MNQKDGKSSSKVWFYNTSINQYIEMKPLPFAACELSAARTPDHKVVLIGSGKKMIIYIPFTKKDDHDIEELPFEVGGGPSIEFDADHNLHILGGKANQQQH